VADGAKLFLHSANGSESPVSVEQFCEPTEKEIRSAVDRRARLKFRDEVVEKLRRKLPGVRVDALGDAD
jgi:hypothetical protein